MDVAPTGLSMRACWHVIAMLAIAPLAAGCASNRCCAPACPPAAVAFDCQPAERQPLIPDVSAVRAIQAIGPKNYCNLPEREAQCLAAMYAPNARLLEGEADAVAAQSSGHHRRDSSAATETALRLQADHERNRNAALAVQLLYRLAAAETAVDNLHKQLDEGSSTIDDLTRLRQAGVELPLSLPQTEAQQAEVRHKLTEMQLTIDLLNEQLANLMGVDLPPGLRFWPDISLVVDPSVPPVEASQMIALAQRADLAALMAAVSGDAATMRSILGLAGAGLGSTSTHCKLLSFIHFRRRGEETAARDDQLQSAIADKQRSIRHEVAQAIATMEARLNQIALAHERLNLLHEHRSALAEKSQVAAGGTFEVRKGSLAVLAAEQDLFQDVIEWKIAVLKLREAQGELAIECGFHRVFNSVDCCP